MPRTTAGPGSNIESVLGEYGVGANSWVSDVFASDTDRLLLALLLEQRGQDLIEALDDAQNPTSADDGATYFSTEEPESVDSKSWETLELGFSASAVTVHGFDAPIRVAFAEPDRANSAIRLSAKQSPFEVAPPTEEFGTSVLHYRKEDSTTNDTQIEVLAF